MIEKIEPWIKGKRVLLLGFGREGRSTWQLLRRLGSYKTLDVADQSSPKQKPEGVGLWITGPDYQKCLDNYDLVFKSPGVVLERPLCEYSCRIVSQTELFFQCFRSQIIGITGTKGKSTTSTLLYHLLKNAGMDTILVGNIGIPVFDHIEEITPQTRIVCELSCHQLEYMTVSPHIGILMNVHEEHLDHYGTMEKYVEAKRHIFLNQKPEDVLVCNVQCLPEEGSCPSKIIRAKADLTEAEVEETGAVVGLLQRGGVTSISFKGHEYEIPAEEIQLLGQHNYFDIGMAYAVCALLGMTDDVFTDGLKSYTPLPHRLQLVGEKDGVKYYDDSISTICDTTIQALKTLEDTDTVLIGGMDRGIDYTDLIEYLSLCSVPHIILMEATGARIYQEICDSYPDFRDKNRLHLASHLEDALECARPLTRRGHSCVMSPAAASYGIFRNFEERGDVFSRLALA